MDRSAPHRFCTTCGHPLPPGAAFCVVCGTPGAAPSGAPGQGASPAPSAAPGQVQSFTPPGELPHDAQAQPHAASRPAFMAAGYSASRRGGTLLRRAGRRPRRPGDRRRGYGCLVLVLAALLGPVIGAALTQGRTRVLFLWVAAGLFGCFLLGGLLLAVLGMLATRRGREELAEGCAEGCLEALLEGVFGWLGGG